MNVARLGLAFAFVAATAGKAWAQPAPGKPAAPKAPAAQEPATKEQDSKAPASKSDADKPEPIPEPEPAPPVGPPAAPPLPPPRPDEQEPRPYTERPPARVPLRNVDLGPDVGVAYRPSSGDTVSYHAAFAWGVHARIELTRWLGFRAFFINSRHEVTIERGALGVADSEIHQPSLEMTLIAARIEPTWVVTPRLRLWGGPSAGLAYFVAPVSTSTGVTKLQSARRTGAVTELGGALGATFDVIPDWFTAQLAGSAAFAIGESGDAFDPPQAFDDTGQRRYMGPLAKFGGSFALMAGLGLVL